MTDPETLAAIAARSTMAVAEFRRAAEALSAAAEQIATGILGELRRMATATATLGELADEIKKLDALAGEAARAEERKRRRILLRPGAVGWCGWAKCEAIATHTALYYGGGRGAVLRTICTHHAERLKARRGVEVMDEQALEAVAP